jgi:hypothetical protein
LAYSKKISALHEDIPMINLPAQAPENDQSKTKVFISYSRKDISFADRLDAALRARGFEPLIDRTDIYAFEEWWKRVETLIGRADTVVFVLSPDAVRPESVARKEVAFAASLNKRFAPIVFRPVEDKLVPEELAKLSRLSLGRAVRGPRGDATSSPAVWRPASCSLSFLRDSPIGSGALPSSSAPSHN